jgi:TonB-dependent SusC/RagA subfamily outer membrane receptor
MRKNLQKHVSKLTLKKSFWFIFTLCQLAFLGVHAQDRSITGVVIGSDDNAGIPGVSIKINGTNKGTNSGANGQFTVSASTNSILEFSMIGYTSKTVTVGNQSTLKVILDVDSRQLQEVIVTALGIKKDVRRIGVAIQSVDGSSTIKAREPNAINALSGRVAGLTVGAQPELLRKPNISLRGSSTILYVVDGVPINSDTWNISPDDIETYSVLKGASASALYGFRGKNGAILITTKRGSADKRGFSVEVNSSTQLQSGFYAIPEVQDEYGPGDHGAYAFGDGKGGGLNDGDYDGGWGP